MHLTRASLLVALLVATAACASKPTATSSETLVPVTTTAVPATATTTSLAVTTTAATVTTTAAAVTTAASTTAAASTTVANGGAILIDVDADSGTQGARTVPLNSTVSITVTSATAQEFHLHGYDIEKAGTKVTFTFTADLAGDFQLESHATEKVLFVLTVAGL